VRPNINILALSLAVFILLLSPRACLSADGRSDIGPYAKITARILVAAPDHVWQAIMDWQSMYPGKGKIRIVHAVSGRIVELRWRGNEMWLRDNQDRQPVWRRIRMAKLISKGIVISPQELTVLLRGRVPPDFQTRRSHRWVIKRGGSLIRVEWNVRKKRLIFSDIKHGRKAVMVILKGSPFSET